MKTRQPLALALVLAATSLACSPTKADTANPDDIVACTEEAKICEDGSSVSRQGPDCEFEACPGEEMEEAEADAGDEPADDSTEPDEAEEPESDAEAEEAAAP
ncbi:MAG: hypothetical protein AB1Z98_31630 [Nannocystaceae bacterium]